jgi:hypothetical protein
LLFSGLNSEEESVMEYRQSLFCLLVPLFGFSTTSAMAQTLVDEGELDVLSPQPEVVQGAEGVDPAYPLFAGNDDSATLDNVQIDVSDGMFITAFSGVDAWGAAYDAGTGTVYHNDGSTLYSWTGGAPVMLGTIMDVAGAPITIHGLAFYADTLYGTSISTDIIYTIDPGTQVATPYITLTDTSASISGLAADPTNGDLYGTDDLSNVGLVRINLDGSLTLIAAYLGGENDVDGLAISGDRMAYLITDDNTPPEFNVYDLNADAYSGTVAYPWGGNAVQVSGAWIGDGDVGPGESVARFPVTKDFDDDNPAEVEVTISCNTGLPLMQTQTITDGVLNGVTFVVTDFEDGAMDCTITETAGVGGYDAAYDDGTTITDDGCTFTGVIWESVNSCAITNSLLPVDVEVIKWWMDENPQFNAVNYAEAVYGCVNEQFGIDASGSLEFFGDGAIDGFSVYPDWDGSTNCWVTETVVDSGVEFDDSECASLSVLPGVGASCAIYNTRLYEGIPTLSQYGLAVLALLMLGLGFVAYRRFV